MSRPIAGQMPLHQCNRMPLWAHTVGSYRVLSLELCNSQLGHATFKVPRSLPQPSHRDLGSRFRTASLAGQARHGASAASARSGSTPSLAARARCAAPGAIALGEPWRECAEEVVGAQMSGNGIANGMAPIAVACQPRTRESGAAVSVWQARPVGVEALAQCLSGTQRPPTATLDEAVLQGISSPLERSGYLDMDVSSVLRELRRVDALRLIRCGLHDRWLARLCHGGGCSKWSGVRLLDLRHNFLTAGCCPAIATVVSGGLQALVLDGNRVQAEGLEALCAAAKAGRRCRLCWLSVAANNIGHPGGLVAASLLEQAGGCTLRGLRLAHNRLGSSGLVAVLRALCCQDIGLMGRRLEQLDCTACGGGPPVLSQLSRTLAQCTCLCVDMAGNTLYETLAADPGGEDAAMVTLLSERFVQGGRLTL